MKATLWISGSRCKIIVVDSEGIVNLNNDWNNIASGESWVYDNYPEAKIRTVRDDKGRKEMDLEWKRCCDGSAV